jgi:LmbE family N-acetylglucosaminyl deacetylase
MQREHFCRNRIPMATKSFSRRAMIGTSGALGAAMTAAARPERAEEALQVAEARHARGRLKVIVTGGHPGDPEYGCGGTIARYADLGHEVVLLYLNRGERSPGSAQRERPSRVVEAERACNILKARPLYAGQVDGNAIVDASHYAAFLKILQAERPDCVFTHWPIDNHADHRAISMLVYDAWLKMKKEFALYYYEVSSGEDTVQFFPTHYVDIGATESRKRLACYAHASQNPDRYYALQAQVTALRGIESGCKQAEAYVRHVQSPDFALPLWSRRPGP